MMLELLTGLYALTVLIVFGCLSLCRRNDKFSRSTDEDFYLTLFISFTWPVALAVVACMAMTTAWTMWVNRD